MGVIALIFCKCQLEYQNLVFVFQKRITTPKTSYVANIYITDIHGLNTSKRRGGKGRGGGVWTTPFLAEMKWEQPAIRKK